jgi:hypothetical protein
MNFDFSELKFKGADETNNSLVFYIKDGQLLKCTLGDAEYVKIGSEYTWEKLDRAYHDVAYMVLPQLTTGEHIEWSWQNEDNLGNNDGKGALALGGQTIAESFDLINQELYKLYPPRSAPLDKVKLSLSDEVSMIEYYDENQKLHTGYDLSKSGDSYWSVKSDKGFYYGNSANISLYVNKGENSEPFSTVQATRYNSNYDQSSEYKENDVTLTLSTTDPYEGGPGAGIWKEASLECKFKPTTEKGVNTTYKLHAGISDIKPTTQGIYNRISDTLVLNFINPVMPNEIEVDVINYDTINTSEVDGTDYINNDFTLKLNSFNICLINTDSEVIPSKHFRKEGIIKISNPGFETIELGISNFVIEQFSNPNKIILKLRDGNYINIPVNVNKYQENFPLTFTYVDLYGEKCEYTYVINNNKVENIKIDNRRRSSSSTENIFPEYSTIYGQQNTYGYLYNYNDNELIFTGDGEGEERKLVSKANSLKQGYYGALTFDLGDVKEINGFILDVISPDELTVNKYSNVTEQFDLYAQILENTTSPNPPASQWINCNEPYDGFSIPGNFADNKQEAFAGMYAGSSNSHKKRVTFGTKTLSGRLFVRLLLRDVNTKIQDIQLVEVI